MRKFILSRGNEIIKHHDKRLDLVLKNLLREIFNTIYDDMQTLCDFSKFKRDRDPKVLLLATNKVSKHILFTIAKPIYMFKSQ